MVWSFWICLATLGTFFVFGHCARVDWNPSLRRRSGGGGETVATCRNHGGRPDAANPHPCQHRCVDTLAGPMCSCWPGFRVAADGVTCRDINECSTGNGGCQQICTNTLGSFRCSCKPGYVLQANGRICAIVSPRHKILPSPRAGRNAQMSGPSSHLHWDPRKAAIDLELDETGEDKEEYPDIGAEESPFGSVSNLRSDVPSPGLDSERDWLHNIPSRQVNEGRVAYEDHIQYSASPCQHCHQVCHWSSSSSHGVRCGCWHGYAITDGSDVGCTDIDECAVHPFLCHNGACINTIGSFICRCHPGYLLVRNICVDVNECAGNMGSQLCDQVCINVPGSYQCSCHKGYALLSGLDSEKEPASVCLDIDECSLGSCSHSCSNYPGGFLCLCPPGMELHHDGRTCLPLRGYEEDEDLDWSKRNVGDDVSRHTSSGLKTTSSQNSPSIQEHASQLSYISYFAGQLLENKAESCSDKCLNGGSCLNGNCICPVGIFGESCQEDVDECLSLPSGMRCSHGCSNTFGSYECSCPPGYVLSGDHQTCTHIGCIPACMNGGICDDSSGKCNCSSGYTGEACDVDVNECEESKTGSLCQHLCQNTIGSFSCICLGRGKTLGPDKRSCVTAPEYSVCFPACRNGGTCKQKLSGQNYCHCPSGFKGRFCQIDVNECSMNLSLCSHICINLHGGYQCLCPNGFKATTVNGHQTECLPLIELGPLSSTSGSNDLNYVQAYPFSLKEDTYYKGNESKENYKIVDNSDFLLSNNENHVANSTLKVLIEIIVSTTNHPNCTVGKSEPTYAPALIALNTKYETEYVVGDFTTMAVKANLSESHVRPKSPKNVVSSNDSNIVHPEVIQTELNSVAILISSSPLHTLTPLLPSNFSLEHEAPVEDGDRSVISNIAPSAIPDKSESFEHYSSVSSELGSPEDLLSDKISMAFNTVVDNIFTIKENSWIPSINVEPLGEMGNLDKIVPTKVQHLTLESDGDIPVLESTTVDVQDYPAEDVESNHWEKQTPIIHSTQSSIVISPTGTNHSINLHSPSIIGSQDITIPGDTLDVSYDDELTQSTGNASDIFDSVSHDVDGESVITVANDILEGDNKTNTNIIDSNSKNSSDFEKNVVCSIKSSLLDGSNSFDDTNEKDVDCLSNQDVVGTVNEENFTSNIFVESDGELQNPENESTVVVAGDSSGNLPYAHDNFVDNSVKLTPHLFEVPVTSSDLSPTVSIPVESKTISHNENIKKIGKPETKSERPQGRKQKSKKGKKNRRKGRKVLRLTPNFEVVNQFNLPSEDNDDSPFPLTEIDTADNSDFGSVTSPGSRYFEVLDYGDEDYDWNVKKPDNPPEVLVTQPLLPLPSSSPANQRASQPLEFSWKDYPKKGMELECLFNGRRFPSRSTFFRDERNCTQCTCKDGELRCAPRHCPPPHCETPMEGDCCEYCPGDCIFGQQVFLPGERFSPHLDPCRECRCEKGGRVLCRDVVCPPLDCDPEFRAIMPGECCPACLSPEPGCFHRGRFFYEGQLWVRQEGGCHACLCKGDGEVQCNPVVCVVNCQHPQFVTGECCPLCGGCQYHSHKYQDHEVFPHPTDTCSLCQCQQGNITCFHKPCEQNCSYPLKKSVNGCCPECTDCLFNGFRMKNGSSLIRHTQDSCEDCTCLGGEVLCNKSICVDECVMENKKWPSGAEFSPGHDPCTDCHCWNGNITCQAVSCPKGPASCSHGILLPGSCCLNCEKCDYRGKLYEDREVFEPDGESCSQCTCHEGNVTCEVTCEEQNSVEEE